ncbi:PREDICTED: uncharacterized protein LOC106751513, partial [Dinoponera quadriceps]|uniref:Uncharacterized protein LOC106751513 n=1 Tax=Dinoponera quadriceps TaxID=609295 RepID=A0A6P3YBX1_DINQU
MSWQSSTVAVDRDYKKDVQLSFQLNHWILKPLGAWPRSPGLSRANRSIYLLLNIICVSLVCFLVIPCVMFIVLDAEDLQHTVEICGAVSFCLKDIVKYSSIIFREGDIRKGIEYIENDWMNTRYYDDRSIMIKSAKFGRRLVAACAFFMYGSAAFYYIAVPFSKGKITEPDGNLTYQPLMWPVARMIIDVRYSPVNEIFFWLQCVSGFVAHSMTTGACSLAVVFAMHAYGRLELLIRSIEHLIDGRENSRGNVDDRLAMIVQQHV